MPGAESLGRVRLGVLDGAHATARLFCGSGADGGGSSWYHWQPDDAGLLWDRLGMTVAFAGMLGLAAAHRVSAVLGHHWAGIAGRRAAGRAVVGRIGNLLPWAVVQLGGMLLVLALACLPRSVQAHGWCAWGQ